MTKSLILSPSFKARGFIGNKPGIEVHDNLEALESSKTKRRRHRFKGVAFPMSLIAFVIACFILTSVMVAQSELAPASISYKREYADGSTSNDGGPNDVVRIEPLRQGEPAGFELVYYFVNHTLVIDELHNNLKNITLFFDRAIERVGGGNMSYYTGLLVDPLIIKVHGSNCAKNLTIYNLPRVPAEVYKNGVPVRITTRGNDLFIKNVTTSTFMVTFESGGGLGGGGAVEVARSILFNSFLGLELWAWIVIFSLIIMLLLVIKFTT